jgi:heterotetrameric sarcosine oxidase gamma subunit
VSAPDHSQARAPLTLAERPRSLVQLMARKGKSETLAAAARQALGLELPAPGAWTTGNGVDATWLQPGGWLLEAEPAAPGAFLRRVAAAVTNLAAAVDQSHGRSVIRITGAETRTVLATCCRLDLHPRVFGPGAAASTLVAHVACVIRALDDGAGFDLVVGATYARWLIEDLLEASAVHGGRHVPAPSPYTSAMPASGSAR